MNKLAVEILGMLEAEPFDIKIQVMYDILMALRAIKIEEIEKTTETLGILWGHLDRWGEAASLLHREVPGEIKGEIAPIIYRGEPVKSKLEDKHE